MFIWNIKVFFREVVMNWLNIVRVIVFLYLRVFNFISYTPYALFSHLLSLSSLAIPVIFRSRAEAMFVYKMFSCVRWLKGGTYYKLLNNVIPYFLNHSDKMSEEVIAIDGAIMEGVIIIFINQSKFSEWCNGKFNTPFGSLLHNVESCFIKRK